MPVQTLRFTGLPGEEKDVEIWLPHDETTQLVTLRTNAPIRTAPPSGRKVWLHHGSSISHGSNATAPTGTWPAVAAAAGNVELLNLGFGGGEQLESLYDHYLLAEPARGRYRFHDLIREHARGLAAADPPTGRDAATARVLDYYLHTARAASAHLTSRAAAGAPAA